MKTDAAKALQHETDFLSGVEANLEAAKGKQLRGTIWKLTRDDESDRLRALLASNRVYDRDKLKSLPSNKRIVLHGFERRLLFGKRATGVAVASVVSPLSHYASGNSGDPPPVGLGELSDHVRRLTTGAKVPHLIGVCSPTGFSDEARRAKLDLPNVTVVLIEPDDRGGWRTMASSEDCDPRVPRIFDPERAKEKVERVRERITQRSADLLTGSLSASSVAADMSLPPEVVKQAFREAAVADPELRATEKEGEFLLFRGAPVKAQETRRSMNVVERIKQLFSREGEEAAKINLLAERRASLAQRRDRIYDDIGKLEKKEAELFEQGKTATSHVPKRRIAAQLAQLRKDIVRQNTTAAMLNKQIDIISTDIHNLTLIQQGEMASLPDTEELTENAVRAEEMLETLKADADLVSGLETGIEETLTSDAELAILKEFEEAAAPSKTAERATPQRTTPERAAPAPRQAASPEPEVPFGEEPPSRGTSKERRRDAEPT